MNRTLDNSPLWLARMAGALYLIIIVLGLFSEVGVRMTLISPEAAAVTAQNILAAEGLFRMGFLADSIMLLCDIGLAALLYLLLRPVSRTLALMALLFRLMQTAIIAVNLLNYYASLLLLSSPLATPALEPDQRDALAAFYLELHGHGYDLGLIPFGVACLLIGYLIAKSRYLPKWLGGLVGAAGVTYLIGSYARFLLPQYMDAIAPIYLIAIVAELSLCLWLLLKGVDAQHWEQQAARGGAGK